MRDRNGFFFGMVTQTDGRVEHTKSGSGSTHQDDNAFMEGAACFESLLARVVGILPQQTVFNEAFCFRIFAFRIQYEVSSNLILHSCQ